MEIEKWARLRMKQRGMRGAAAKLEKLGRRDFKINTSESGNVWKGF